MAGSVIFSGRLTIIFTRHAENAKRPGKPAFPDFQGHFHEHEGRLECGTSRAARWRVEASSNEAPAEVSHPVEPTLPLGITRSIDHPQQGFADARHVGEGPADRHVLGGTIDRFVPAYDEPRRPSRKQPPQMAGSLSIALDCPPDRFAAIATHSSGQPATRLAPIKSVLSQYGPSGSGGC